MLLQRLTLDSVLGFSFDYMGSREYEGMAPHNGCLALARSVIDNTATTRDLLFSDIHCQQKTWSVPVTAFGHTATLGYLATDFIPQPTHKPFRLYDVSVVGWLLVNQDPLALYHPLLLVRASVENIDRKISRFLAPAVRQLQAEALASDAA